MVLLNVALLAPMSTGAVEEAVIENFEEFSKESACDDDDCTTAEDDWAVSSSQRDFYGYSITNVNDVMASGATPTYEKIGPVTYDITTTRTITGYDATAGELTYNSVKSFECAEDTTVPCDTEVSQLNIAFQTQVIGATGLAIGGIMDATKAGFTRGMLAQDLGSLSVGAPAASVVSTNMSQTAAYLEGVMMMPAEMAAAAAPAALADNYWNGYADNFQLAAGGLTYNQVYGLHENFSANFSSDSNINMSYAFYDAMGPGGEDLSLTGALGATMLAGHCSSFPTENSTTIMGMDDMTNSGTMTRATLWGYMAMANATIPDVEMTIARDWAMCAGVGMTFQTLGGGDDTWMFDTTGTSVNASTRLSYLGITMDNTAAMLMLFGAPGDDNITGLLEVSESGTEFGVANFLSMDATAAMAAYGMDNATHDAVAGWAGAWIADGKSLPMILLGGSGDMTASLFVNTTFGAEDPLNGGYLENSLNLGGFWGLPEGRDNITLDPAVSGNALYGPLGLTTSTGSAIFLYGELSGMTPPLNFSTSPPTPGTPMVWDEATIGALYGVDTNAAAAMRALMMGPIYGTTAESFVPGFLMSSFGATPYLTQSFNNWLLGWHDPVSAFLATGNPMDMTVGWTSLETNETYFSSPNVANGDGTNYTMCTGEGGDCDQGETLAEDGSTQLSWRNDAMFAATFGLISPESLVGTTGGFLTGDGDKVDVSGYAIADVICEDTATVKGIPVKTCSASVVATERNIQANLLET
ncbi:MAG: CD36 family protein, partial [Candidatus Poseidonia sp.]|nr:CD36 family protein [Poseidonia sp.]